MTWDKIIEFLVQSVFALVAIIICLFLGKVALSLIGQIVSLF